MNLKETKATKAGKLTIVTFFQSLYLTISSFVSNDLLSYASACAFGFLFSFVPIVMLTLVILVRLLHASPETVTEFIVSNFDFTSYFNLDNFVNSVTSIHTITNFEIIIGISIIWMARRFFSSVFGGLKKIFGSEQNTKPLIMQLIILAGELLVILLIAFFIFSTIAAKTFLKFEILNKYIINYPLINSLITKIAHNSLSFVLLFFITMIAYRIGSRTKPKLILTAIMSAGSTTVSGFS